MTQPTSQTVFVDHGASLAVTVVETGPFTFQWYKGNQGDTTNPISGATSSTFNTAPKGIFDRSRYWVRTRDACLHTIDSDTALVVTTDKRPLIFISGIAGSVIFEQGGDTLWPIPAPAFFPCNGYNGLTLDPTKLQPQVVIPDVIRTVELPPPIGSQPGYEALLNRLRAEGYRETGNQTLFVFPYDWRKTNSAASLALRTLVQNIRNSFPQIDVDIVAHSMGGLVAQRYALDNTSNHHLHKFITIGTPWLGAPKAINVLETGQFLEIWKKVATIYACTSTIKTLSEYFQGVHELIPSLWYSNLSILPSFVEAGWDINENGQASEIYDYPTLVSMLDHRYPISKPGRSNSLFHSIPGQDDGRLAPSNISYYHIHGRLLGNSGRPIDSTIGEVVAKRGVRCNGTTCYISNYIDLRMTSGDGTVPSVSASRRGRGQDLNEPTSLVFPPYNADHVGLCNNDSVLDKMIELLSPNFSATAAKHLQQAAPQDEESEPSYYLQVIGNPSISVSDAHDNSSVITGIATGSEVPGVTSYIMGEKAFMLVLSVGQAFTVTFRTGNEPLTINLTLGTNEVTSQAIRYSDVTIPPNVNVKLEFTVQGPAALKYDPDGDGTFRSTVEPTASVTGVAAQDITPPSITFETSTEGNNTLVTITSSDLSSGVKTTYFSLNGKDFQPYSGPFTVNRHQAPAVYAFADDNVGNRSGLATHPFINAGVPLLVTQATSNRAIAFDSVLRLPEPFPLTYDHSWGTDTRTRIMSFAMNFDLGPNETPAAVTATAVDGTNRLYDLPVEYVGKVPGAEWLTSIVIRLNDNIGNVGDVLLTISVHGNSSNAVRVAIGHTGGGPPDP